MSRLLKLKEWLTLDDASRHLSTLYEEPITEADLLRLALDGHLTLSVQLVNHASAKIGKAVALESARIFEMLGMDGKPFLMVSGVNLDEGHVIDLEEKIVSISGIWDLTMRGAEHLDIEHKYQYLTNGPGVTLESLEGTIIRQGEVFAQIQEHFEKNEFFDKKNLNQPRWHQANYYPAGSLPEDSVLVVRIEALEELKRRLGDEPQIEEAENEKPQRQPEREGRRGGGRPMSPLWPEWVAELVAHIHEEGIPKGVANDGAEALITRVADGLAARGLEGPSRSTVQDAVQAVLRRLRLAGN